jgi:outer membrane protein
MTTTRMRPLGWRPANLALTLAIAATIAAPPVWAQQQPAGTVTAGETARRNDLLHVFREAMTNDAVLAAARAQQLATQERVPQARAGTLPTVGLTSRIDQNIYDSTQPSTSSNYQVFGAGINLSVPVYRPQNWTALEQARIAVVQSEAQLAQSQQDLALRVAIAYFNLLTARDQLIALDAAKRATGEQLQQARREFEVGTKTIIDTNEAQARFDQITAQEQVAVGTLLVRRSELQTIIGRDLTTVAPLVDRPAFNPPDPPDINAWVRAAEDNGYAVQIARASQEIATREIERARATGLPTVDAVGGYNVNQFRGTQASDLNPRIGAGSIGLQLNFPIYNGGLVQSRVREALALQQRSEADLDFARRSASNAARDAYTGVNYGLAQVTALESAEVSARTQLESTQLGYQVGVRIQLDMLNATTQLVQTQRDLKRARYDFLLSALRLKAAAGTLGETDIAAVNTLLAPPEPVVPPPSTEPILRTPPPGSTPAPGMQPGTLPAPATSGPLRGMRPGDTTAPLQQPLPSQLPPPVRIAPPTQPSPTAPTPPPPTPPR